MSKNKFPSRAWLDLEEVTQIAERGVMDGCMPTANVRNAFQVFRRALAKWAEGKDRGRVWRMINYGADEVGEVSVDLALGEMEIYCEDEGVAKAIEDLLKGGGYEADD